MDVGYVVLLLLCLVYCGTAIFLYARAKQREPGVGEVPQASSEEPEAP
jgi:hypothetical protein